jgi:hypothetical protein
MRHIKRLGAVLIVLIVMLGLLIIPAAAEDVAEPENTPVDGVIDGGEADTPPEQNNTVLARVYEWAVENISEIVTVLSGAVMAGYALYQRGKNGTLINGVARVLKSQGGVESATQNMTSCMYELKAQQAELNNYYEEYAKNEAERNKVTGALLVEVMSLVELQHILLINNGSIPQAIKNLATSKYARCLSTINDDAEIKAVYDEMRNVLGITEAASDEKTTT